MRLCIYVILNWVYKTLITKTLVYYNLLCICGGLKRYDPHRLMCVIAWHIGKGTLRRDGLVGVHVTLLDGVWKCGGGL